MLLVLSRFDSSQGSTLTTRFSLQRNIFGPSESRQGDKRIGTDGSSWARKLSCGLAR